MKYPEYEVVAPPRTKELLLKPPVKALMNVLVGIAVAQELIKNVSDHSPLQPSDIRVAPFLSPDNHIRYAVDSWVKLAGTGMLQVRHHTFETAPLDDNAIGVINVDTGEVVLPDLDIHRYTLSMIGMGYVMEAYFLSQPEA